MKSRIISISLLFVLIMNLICSSVIPVFAEEPTESASSRQNSFLNFYADSDGMILDSQNLSSTDYYTLAVFLSNYYQPGVTTLKDIVTPTDSEMIQLFTQSLGKSGDAQLLGVIESFGKDTVKGIEGGYCTIFDDNGNTITGQGFLTKMNKSVGTTGFNQSIVKFGGKLGVAFDFSSPAVRAAFQTVNAYNPMLFADENGIGSLDIFFLDAVGNLWGGKVDSSIQSDIQGITKADSLSNITTKIGLDNIYLVLPACLNPSTFSPNIKNQQDLRMPLMNSFVLGSILNYNEIVGADGTNKISEKDIPFYNLIGALNKMGKSNDSSLIVFGTNSVSPYLMNSGKLETEEWNEVERKQDLATFYYDPSLISVKTNTLNGVGKFGTNSYIVFSPKFDADNYVIGDYVNYAVDMKVSLPWIGAFTFSNFKWISGTNNRISEQKTLLRYLYTPTILSLNQVSMQFYLEAGNSAQNSDDAYEVMSQELTADAVAAKMGYKGFSLFMNYVGDSVDFGDGEYVGMLVDRKIQSKFVSGLLGNADSWQDVDIYKKLKVASSSKDLDELSSVLDSSVLTKVKELYHFSTFTNSFVGVNDEQQKVVKDTGTGTYNDYNNTDFYYTYNVNNTGSTANTYRYYITPRKFVNVGNWGSDITLSPTLGIGDTGVLKAISSAVDGIANKNVADSVSISGLSEKAVVDYLLTYYGYTLFFPSEHTYTALNAKKTLDNITMFGEGSYKVGIYLSHPDNKDFLMGMYFGYILDMMGLDNVSESGWSAGNFHSDFLPVYGVSSSNEVLGYDSESSSGMINSDDVAFEEMQKDLIKRVYGITNDSNNDYRNNLIKNILDGFILTVHRTITGTWSANMSTVSTGNGSTYQSLAGYIYTPILEELPFTGTLMNNYVKMYTLCLLLIAFLVFILVLLKMRTWQHGVSIILIMSFALLLPYILISNTVNISNKVSDGIYSDRFDFWALSEHYSRLTSLNNTVELDEKDRLLALTNATADATYNGDTGVKIKWMSPKKVEMFKNLYSDKSLSDSFVTNMEIFKWLFSSFIYDSEFVETQAFDSYLYRPYNSIALEAKAYYQWGLKLMEKDTSGNKSVELGDITFYNIPNYYAESLGKFGANTTANKDDYLAGLARMDTSYYTNGLGKLSYSQDKLDDVDYIRALQSDNSDLNNIKVALWGSMNLDLASKLFNTEDYRIPGGNYGVTSNLPSITSDTAFDTKDIPDISKAIYLKNTESPFYYFYSTLKYRYMGNSSDGTFKKSLLDSDMYTVKNNEGYLYKAGRNANNQFRDFLDLEGLFTYVIPYLKDSNDYVLAWQKANTSNIEEYNFKYDVLEDGSVDESTIGLTEEQKANNETSTVFTNYKDAVVAKNTMNKIWNMYCPWVDSLYDLNVYNKKVSVGGKSIYIGDTLNPSSYIEQGRPMIFSEADMTIKGYTYKDLTDIERRIQAVLEKTYDDLMYLVNYYDMDDEVLISAAAMYATFNFNSEFSQSSFLGNSVMLYPQGFELKNFNYDAFMRLALLNSTGESVFATEDLYSRVITKTSIVTGFVLLLCDIVACIIIPVFKFVILVSLLFLGILMCITCVVNPPEKINQAILKCLVAPTLLFMILNIGFAWVMSFIVGEGLTSYVGSKSINFTTNDPTITMLIMAFLGLCYAFCSFKIIKALVKTYRAYGASTAMATLGLIGAAATAGAATLSSMGKKVTGTEGLGASLRQGASTPLSASGVSKSTEAKGMKANQTNKRKIENLPPMESHSPDTGPSLTDKINKLSQTPKVDSPRNTDINPDLPTSFKKATDKKANLMGRGLSNAAYFKNKVKDAVDGVDYNVRKTGYSIKNMGLDSVTSAKGAISSVKETPSTVKNYFKSSLDTYKKDSEYYTLVRNERNKERSANLDKASLRHQDPSYS